MIFTRIKKLKKLRMYEIADDDVIRNMILVFH